MSDRLTPERFAEIRERIGCGVPMTDRYECGVGDALCPYCADLACLVREVAALESERTRNHLAHGLQKTRADKAEAEARRLRKAATLVSGMSADRTVQSDERTVRMALEQAIDRCKRTLAAGEGETDG